MFADDTNIYYENDSLEEMEKIELKKLSLWLRTNRLSLQVEAPQKHMAPQILHSRFCTAKFFKKVDRSTLIIYSQLITYLANENKQNISPFNHNLKNMEA